MRNEIQNDRKTQIDQLRMEGASIQQEFDLLNQKFLEDIMSLKDELNGLFNDRKMVTRAEQRAMENKVFFPFSGSSQKSRWRKDNNVFSW